jgi:hypothetical protein
MSDFTASHGETGRNTPSANEDVAKLRLQLNQFSLSELVSKGLVEWEKDDNIVTKGPQFDEKRLE